MKFNATSLRPFIGARDYNHSRQFYTDLGFTEFAIASNMCRFAVNETLSFYLQDAYVQDWINNTMLFVEVQNVQQHYQAMLQMGLQERYKNVKLLPIVNRDWGSEFFLIDPSGILWHFGEFG
ncbi:MAG: glyoxalase [Chitinophagaceae bacterium]|nr:MAG: glyoxalase [Chitinophagaceae bacterium]